MKVHWLPESIRLARSIAYSLKVSYKILGMMSGTSLDGLDLALCEFVFDGKWSFKLIEAETLPYDEGMHRFLSSVYSSSGEELASAHTRFGRFLGEAAKSFLQRKKLQADYISSHGHTIFHQPAKGYTFQLGDGNAIAAVSGLPVVYDFRSKDVALGGQGAPLVPVGDRLLFGEYDYCLNLGGIANISFEQDGKRLAYDVCPCNLVLNHLAGLKGMSYDRDGQIASSGIVQKDLLEKLNNWSYYQKQFPKSLGREDMERDIFPLLENKYSAENLSATFCEHIAQTIGHASKGRIKKMLVTGGGAFHKYLIGRLNEYCESTLIIPPAQIINFKEAIIFAFLAALRLENQINTLSSVTGANHDSVGGVICY